MSLELSEYLDDFIQEAEELMAKADEDLLCLEKDPANRQALDSLFRTAHTLKGSSAMMGFDGLREYAHKLESALSLIRSGEWDASEERMELLFHAFGVLNQALAKVREKGGEDRGFIEPRLAELELALEGGRDSMASSAASTSATEDGRADQGSARAEEAESAVAAGKEETRRESKGDKGREGKGPRQAVPLAATPPSRETDSVRVSVAKLDGLLDSLGELVLKRTRTLKLLDELRKSCGPGGSQDLDNLSSSLAEESRILTELQQGVMKVRMLPLSILFSRCPRIVRDAARKLGKEVEIEVAGSATELDKKLIDALAEPFIHLLTNAVSHGIEPPDERRRSGKPRAGTIRIKAFSEHNQVVVKVEDDGRGIDFEKLRGKAEAMNLHMRHPVEKMSPGELFDLLAVPGLSLAKEVTEISGRGVGIDAVKRKIEEINGSIEVYSRKGAFTAFVIHLPLTLAIVPALLVRYLGTTFAFPLSCVEEVLRSTELKARQAPGAGTIVELRGKVLPVTPLDELMHFAGKRPEPAPYLVVVRTGEERFLIPVAELLGRKEIVVKTVSPLLGLSKLFTGASILGDGEIVLILDPYSIAKSKHGLDPSAPVPSAQGH